MKYAFLGSLVIALGGVIMILFPHLFPPVPVYRPANIRAVYLVRGSGELSQRDLRNYPEIVVTGSFTELKEMAKKKVAIWIDKNAVGLIESQWLDREPQNSFPIVLVGYNNSLYAFRDKLHLCCFFGPMIDWNGKNLTPGFSIIQRASDKSGFLSAVYLKDFQQKPQIGDILEVTNALLDNKIVLTPGPPSNADFTTPTPPFRR